MCRFQEGQGAELLTATSQTKAEHNVMTTGVVVRRGRQGAWGLEGEIVLSENCLDNIPFHSTPALVGLQPCLNAHAVVSSQAAL